MLSDCSDEGTHACASGSLRRHAAVGHSTAAHPSAKKKPPRPLAERDHTSDSNQAAAWFPARHPAAWVVAAGRARVGQARAPIARIQRPLQRGGRVPVPLGIPAPACHGWPFQHNSPWCKRPGPAHFQSGATLWLAPAGVLVPWRDIQWLGCNVQLDSWPRAVMSDEHTLRLLGSNGPSDEGTCTPLFQAGYRSQLKCHHAPPCMRWGQPSCMMQEGGSEDAARHPMAWMQQST
jgi:hypothetical protein